MNPYFIDDSILQQDLYPDVVTRTAARMPPGPIHDAADNFVARLENSLEYAFAKGRAAVDTTTLRNAETPAQALSAMFGAVDASADALELVLPSVFRKCFDAGGEAAVEKWFRTAGGPGSGNFGHAGRPGEIGGSAPSEESSPETEVKENVNVFAEMEKSGRRKNEIATEIAQRMPGNYLENRDYVNRYLTMWADTSTGTPRAALLQHAVAEEFDLKNFATDHLMDVEKYNQFVSAPTWRERDRAFVRAEYENTQKWFKDRGITHVSVYRGMRSGLPKESGNIKIRMQPASSWSLVTSDAYQFAAGALPGWGGGVIATRVPVSRVLSTAVSGRGAISEAEVILLGGEYNARKLP